MLGQPIRGKLLCAEDAGERRQILGRSLLDAGAGRRLEAEDENESGHLGPFAAAAKKRTRRRSPRYLNRSSMSIDR